MNQHRRLDIEALHTELRRVLRHGARAARLVHYSPELVELLLPEDASPRLTIYDRAIQVEDVLRQAIQTVGGIEGDALMILFCFEPGTLGLTLEQRRQQAGELFGLLPGTFRRDRWEGMLLWEVGVEVYRRLATGT